DGHPNPPATPSRAALSASRTTAADPVGSPGAPASPAGDTAPRDGDPSRAARSASRASSDGRGVMSSS
ncbi:hypothetical protein ACFW05_29465, partial [Streptomyces albogriseolus]